MIPPHRSRHRWLGGPIPARLAGRVALAALLGACDAGDGASSAVDAGVPCVPSPTACEGTVLAYCDENGLRQAVDCADKGQQCLHDSAGVPYCALPCPTGGDTVGHCLGTRLTKCDGELLIDLDCGGKSPAQACALDRTGEAFCTDPVPEGIDERGTCEGTRLRQRSGAVFIDYDCATSDPPQRCARDAQGFAQCTLPCPAGLDGLGGCAGTRLTKCSGEVFIDVDCAGGDTTGACGRDAAGEAFCAELAPPGLTESGVCAGTRIRRRNGEVVTEIDCAGFDPPGTCALDALGDPRCTAPLPPEVTELGECQGTRLRRRSGAVLLDVDCATSGRKCARNGVGRAFCTEPCPVDLDDFGRCDGDVARTCDGEVLVETDCAAHGQTCRLASRFGAACVGCGDVPPGGACSPEGILTACTPSGTSYRENCAGQGKTCGWDAEACAYDCLPQTALACDGYGLDEGEVTCWKASATDYLSIVRCTAGEAVVQECPASSDASIGCTESGGEARCTATCTASGRRCTDRGVLVTCGDDPTLGALDCAVYGAECVESADDAFCACGPLSAEAAQCSHGWQATCRGGRLERAPCTCDAPP